MKNMGNESGPGKCQLLGATTDSNSVEDSVQGPLVLLPVVDHGKAVTEALIWQGPVQTAACA